MSSGASLAARQVAALLLRRCGEILQRAGATPLEVAQLTDDMKGVSAEDIEWLESYLERQSPCALMRFIDRMRCDAQYVPGPDSRQRPGVPRGKSFTITLDQSEIFPGAERSVTVFVPAQYRAETPACVYVGLDGLQCEAAATFENLIHSEEMPTTIGIGIYPGRVASAAGAANPRFNRSFEFDSLNGDFAEYILREVLPCVEAHETPDGLPIRLSADPNDRAVGGMSTGGIAAFTLGWEHPNAFRRIFTASGTFVGMRGGDRYPILVRKTEPKPLRIFMQDGSRDELDDLLGEMGDWWMSNQAMQRALQFAGYQVAHMWGEGPHGSRQSTVVFPDAMRWLWKDWPRLIVVGESRNTFLRDILFQGEAWRPVGGSYRSAEALVADRSGVILFWDARTGKTWNTNPDGAVREHLLRTSGYIAAASGPDGRLYVADASCHKILVFDANGAFTPVVDGVRVSNVLVDHTGAIYFTEVDRNERFGRLWLLVDHSRKILLDAALSHPTGLAISPDGLWLCVAEQTTHWGYSYRIQPDGTVQAKQRFYWFHVPDCADDSGARAWVMDREGRLYAATRLGVQVFDRNGRVRAILPVPGGPATGLTFGGPDFSTLYVSCADDRLYQRRLNTSGAMPWSTPIPLPPHCAA